MSAVRSRPTPQSQKSEHDPRHDRFFFNQNWVNPLFMWYAYILYSASSGKTYTGFSNDLQRRLTEHNVSESKGFTLRYRPWVLIRSEIYSTKTEAMEREKFLKSGRGREQVKEYVGDFLNNGAVSAAAEKD